MSKNYSGKKLPILSLRNIKILGLNRIEREKKGDRHGACTKEQIATSVAPLHAY